MCEHKLSTQAPKPVFELLR